MHILLLFYMLIPYSHSSLSHTKLRFSNFFFSYSPTIYKYIHIYVYIALSLPKYMRASSVHPTSNPSSNYQTGIFNQAIRFLTTLVRHFTHPFIFQFCLTSFDASGLISPTVKSYYFVLLLYIFLSSNFLVSRRHFLAHSARPVFSSLHFHLLCPKSQSLFLSAIHNIF